MNSVKTKKGISLIVLVITILVMIILAGVVIVSLTQNNPIEKANRAKLLDSISSVRIATTSYAALTQDPNGNEKMTDIRSATVVEGDFNKFTAGANTLIGVPLTPPMADTMYCVDDLGNVKLAVKSSATKVLDLLKDSSGNLPDEVVSVATLPS